MGWLWLALIALGALILLRAGGMPRSLVIATATALLLGGAGYALQQNATLPGQPVRAESRAIDVDPGMVAFRTAILTGTPGEIAILAAADDRIRGGDTRAAIDLLLAATDRQPRSAALWTGLGNALVIHGAGRMSPAATLAFGRALGLAPRSPGPAFFFGLAQAGSGDLAAARQSLLRALALAPPGAAVRIVIAEQLVMIDRYLAMQAASGRPD